MSLRKNELSLLNVIFCLAVIMIHILSYPISAFEVGSFKYNAVMIPWRLLSFVVQGFVFLSGLKAFLTGRDKIGWLEYLRKRIVTVFIPYVICFCIYYIFYMRMYSYRFEIGLFFEDMFFGKLASHFYFIPLILQFDLLMPLWKRIVSKCSPVVVIPIALIISAVSEMFLPVFIQYITNGKIAIMNDRLFTTYFSFWIIGCYIGKYYEEFLNLAKKNYKIICLFFFVSTVLCAVFSYIGFNDIMQVPEINVIHYMYSVAVIIFLLSFFSRRKLCGITGKPLFLTIDALSYDIYLWHMLFLFIADELVKNLGFAMQSLAFLLRVVFVYSVTLAFVWLAYKIRRRLFKSSVPNVRLQ